MPLTLLQAVEELVVERVPETEGVTEALPLTEAQVVLVDEPEKLAELE